MILSDYEQPVPDRLLYYIAHRVNVLGRADANDLVQEGRIRMWQVWQEIEWVRTKEQPQNPQAYYAKVAQRRMQTVCYGKSATFGGQGRQGYQDAMTHADNVLDDDAAFFAHPVVEIPFELLDRIPGILLAEMVLSARTDSSTLAGSHVMQGSPCRDLGTDRRAGYGHRSRRRGLAVRMVHG